MIKIEVCLSKPGLETAQFIQNGLFLPKTICRKSLFS